MDRFGALSLSASRDSPSDVLCDHLGKRAGAVVGVCWPNKLVRTL